jgi:hypothetical protein
MKATAGRTALRAWTVTGIVRSVRVIKTMHLI